MFFIGVASVLMALFTLVRGDSDEFGLIAIASGTAIQYLGVVVSSNVLVFGSSGDNFQGTILDDTTLSVSSGGFVSVSNTGVLTVGSRGVTGFSITANGLLFQGSSFYACPRPGGQDYNVIARAVGSCDNGYSPLLRPVDSTGQSVPLFPEDGSDNSDANEDEPGVSYTEPETSAASTSESSAGSSTSSPSETSSSTSPSSSSQMSSTSAGSGSSAGSSTTSAASSASTSTRSTSSSASSSSSSSSSSTSEGAADAAAKISSSTFISLAALLLGAFAA